MVQLQSVFQQSVPPGQFKKILFGIDDRLLPKFINRFSPPLHNVRH